MVIILMIRTETIRNLTSKLIGYRWCFRKAGYNTSDLARLEAIKWAFTIWGTETIDDDVAVVRGYLEYRNCKAVNKAYMEKKFERDDLFGFEFAIADKSSTEIIDGLPCGGDETDTEQREKRQNRDYKTEVYWLYGPHGSGKSTSAMENCPFGYWKDCDKYFWDGYDDHEDVILDNYVPNKQLNLNMLQKLMDDGPLQVQIHGGIKEFNAYKLYIVTDKSPLQMAADHFGSNIDMASKFLALIDHVVEFPICNYK